MPVAVLSLCRSLAFMDWTPERIRELRERLDLTQTEFARVLGYDRFQSVSDLEQGRRKPGGPVVKLLDILHVYGPLPTEGQGGEGREGT